MVEIKLSDDVIDKIKDFDHWYLTEKQKSLIDKLILNEELKKRYVEHGLCKECRQPNADGFLQRSWCQPCNTTHFQQNFKNWTSGNHDVDEFIQKTQLKTTAIEWIEYDRFENIECLTKGSFGTTYKAIWKDGHIESWDPENNQWRRNRVYKEGYPVALKYLHDSQDISVEFLRKIESHLTMNNSAFVIQCYGITKDTETNNFVMVMEYAKNGNLRKYLNDNFNKLNWKAKLYNIYDIAHGLCKVHENGLIHCDFHCGNILMRSNDVAVITDLGLCHPANIKPSPGDDKKIYGVLPYVAPEVLRGQEYTQASDIYGFGIIAYEVCTGFPPYHDMAHDESLAIKICQGLRPKFNYKIPNLVFDIIKQCWDADPLKRPKAEELDKLFYDLYFLGALKKNSFVDKQIGEARWFNKQIFLSTSTSTPTTGVLVYTTHSQAVYTSRLLDFKNLPEPKNADNEEQNVQDPKE